MEIYKGHIWLRAGYAGYYVGFTVRFKSFWSPGFRVQVLESLLFRVCDLRISRA